jgi:hypothetical protein
MYKVIFGRIGSDGGYWYIGADGKVHHVPGWQPELIADLTRALSALRQLGEIKTPGVAEHATKGLMEFVQGQLGQHLGEQLKGGGVLVVGG